MLPRQLGTFVGDHGWGMGRGAGSRPFLLPHHTMYLNTVSVRAMPGSIYRYYISPLYTVYHHFIVKLDVVGAEITFIIESLTNECSKALFSKRKPLFGVGWLHIF